MTGEIIEQLLLAGILGLSGQVIRSLVGIKKINDDAVRTGKSIKDLFDVRTLLVSLLIGFVAGILALISISTFQNDFFSGPTIKQNLLMLIAAGYAGTDFIEGFIRKYIPDTSANSAPIDTNANTEANQKQPEFPTDAYKTNQPAAQAIDIPIPKPGGIHHS